MGFTFLFVNALPPGTVEPGDAGTDVTTTLAPGGTGDGDGTATTLPAADDPFLVVIDGFATRGAGLAGEAQTINDDWDAGGDFAATRDALTDLANRTGTFAAEVAAAEVPPAGAEAWVNVTAAAEAMNTAAGDMVTGLVDSSGPDDRLAALAAYTAAASDLATTLDLTRTAIGG